MKKHITNKLTVAASLILWGYALNTAWADGTETLDNAGIAIQSGSGIVAAGTGLISQPGTINIDIPGTVKQVLLYWAGQTDGSVGDNLIEVNGNIISGTLIGGPSSFAQNKYNSTFRSDITSLQLVTSGPNTLIVEGLSFGYANSGAGVMVIYDDGSPANIQLQDGNDLAYKDFVSPFNIANAQSFTFAPNESVRNSTLSMFFSGVKDVASENGSFRPNAINVTVSGITTVYNNLLSSNDGSEWDTLTLPVIIPAGATSLTVQAFSVNNMNTGYKPASFAWNAAGLSIEEQRQGCTPSY